MDNLYDLIGARPDDDAEGLKKAYRSAVKATHPDHHRDDPGAVTRFMEIAAAYRVLRDGGQRAAYDQTLEPATAAAPPQARPWISTMTFGVAAVVALSGGFMVLARVSGNADGPGRTAPQAHETAAVQPAGPAVAAMPIVVPAAMTADDTADKAAADRTAAVEPAGGTAPEAVHAAAQDITSMPAAAAASAAPEPAGTAAPPAAPDTTASPAAVAAPAGAVADVARHDVDPGARVNRPTAPEKHAAPASGPYALAFPKHDAARPEVRTNARMRDAADAGDGRVPAPRRSAGGSSLEPAALAGGDEPCAGPSCGPAVTPLFGVGF